MNKSIILFLVIQLSININLISQNFDITGENSFGGSNHDRATQIVFTSDSGYIVGGYTLSSDGHANDNHTSDGSKIDAFLLKFNHSGNLEWSKCLGGTNSERSYSIIQCSDKGYLSVGQTNSSDGDVSGFHGGLNDIWAIKLDSLGNIEWQNCLGGSGDDMSHDVIETNTGDYFIAGTTFQSEEGDVSYNHGSKDIWLSKLNNSGQLIWEKSLGGTFEDEARAIYQTNDNGFIIVGNTYSNNGDVSGNHSTYASDIWVLKIDQSGNKEWQKCLGGTNTDVASDIKQTSDGGYIVLGSVSSDDGDISSYNGGYDYWIVKLDQSGNIDWEKTAGGNSNDYATEIIITNDNHYIAVGEATSGGDVSNIYGTHDIWLVELDMSGNIIDEKNFGGSSHDESPSIIEKNPNHFTIVATTRSDDYDVSINYGEWDIWIINVDKYTFTNEINKTPPLNAYPIPTSDFLIIKCKINTEIKIYNLNGQVIDAFFISDENQLFDVSKLKNGVYLMNGSYEGKNIYHKFIKI